MKTVWGGGGGIITIASFSPFSHSTSLIKIHYSTLIIGINLAMEIIHKDNVKFPNFSQNATYFPNSMGPSPIPKKVCESPAFVYKP